MKKIFFFDRTRIMAELEDGDQVSWSDEGHGFYLRDGNDCIYWSNNRRNNLPAVEHRVMLEKLSAPASAYQLKWEEYTR